MKRFSTLAFVAAAILVSAQASAKDYYVSASKGKGRTGSKTKPAKDLGNILSKLEPGDVVHIAGGVYTGRGDNGSNVLTVPVSVIGGYDDDFQTRDPWGKHQTVFSGDNKSDNWERTPGLMIDLMKYRGKEMPEIRVDGIIVDQANRNRYKTADQNEIVRSANPAKKENPTPDQGGLVIRVSKTGNFQDAWKIVVQNCIVMNTAGTQGALSVSGYEGSECVIRNNLVINNTGTGICCGTKFRPRGDQPKASFLVENNTVLFSWKFDPSAQSYSGNSIKFDPDVEATVKSNVFGFADRYGVHNAGKSEVLLQNNLVIANVLADYLEFDTKMNIDEIEDESEYLHEDTEGNVQDAIQVKLDAEWSKKYGTRVLVDRNVVEQDVKAQQTRANELRAILGLPLQAGPVDVPATPVWLHRLQLADAIQAGSQPYLEKYGCQVPK